MKLLPVTERTGVRTDGHNSSSRSPVRASSSATRCGAATGVFHRRTGSGELLRSELELRPERRRHMTFRASPERLSGLTVAKGVFMRVAFLSLPVPGHLNPMAGRKPTIRGRFGLFDHDIDSGIVRNLSRAVRP